MTTKYITHVEYPYSKKWDKENKYVTFKLSNVDNSYANAIRRIILTDIKSIGFKTRPYNESDIVMVKNETDMDNQKLSHRIGMIPINIEYPESFDVNDHQFYINKENTTPEVMTVTSEDFMVKKLSTDKNLSREEVKKMFPPNVLTNDYIFICYLAPDKTGNKTGGKLHFNAKASLRTARDDAKFNVALCAYANEQDPKKVEKAWKDYYEEEHKKTGESKEILRRRFDIGIAPRHFYTDEYGFPSSFNFFIEAFTSIPPMVVLHSALNILQQKITNFINNIANNNFEEVDIYPSEVDMKAFDFLISHETHTLVVLLQSYIWQLFGGDNAVTFVGDVKPHPLQNKCIVRVALRPDINTKENATEIVVKTCKKLLEMNKMMIDTVASDPTVSKFLK